LRDPDVVDVLIQSVRRGMIMQVIITLVVLGRG